MLRLRKIAIRTLATLVVLALIALIGIGWFGSERLVSPPRRDLQEYHLQILSDPARFGLSVTEFSGFGGTPCLLVSPAGSPGEARKSRELRDSLARRGFRPPAWGDIRGTVILLHGHTGRKEDHLPICERFCAAGFRCLLPDLPGHGDHPSTIATFGMNESSLVEKILDQAESTFGFEGQPAMLFGVSQGGAIALQTAARQPERWTAVASAAAFSSLDRPILHSARSFHPYLRPLAGLNALAVECGAWCRGGLWPASIRPHRAASRLRMPVMIIHGEQDRFVPIDQGRAIFDAIPSPAKTFRPVANAGHGRVLAEDAGKLYPEICGFFLEAVAKSGERASRRDRSH